MKTIKNTIQMTILGSAATLLLSACGGGGGTTTPPAANEKEIVACSSGTTTVQKDDKILAKDADTKVRVIHKEDATKSVCVETGNAVVVLP